MAADPSQAPLFDLGTGNQTAAKTSAARIDFLAGMLSTWTLGPGVKATAAQREQFQAVARAAIENASSC